MAQKKLRRAEPEKEEERQWENPVEPSLAGDDRDKEQLIRQYKEARRLKDNLTNNDKQTDN